MKWLAVFLLMPLALGAQQRQTIDYALAGTTTALILADWSQTLRIAADPLHQAELNPVLGRHPSTGRVNTICALGLLANIAALRLPAIPRRIWYVTVMMIEAYAVRTNLRRGLSIGF